MFLLGFPIRVLGLHENKQDFSQFRGALFLQDLFFTVKIQITDINIMGL